MRILITGGAGFIGSHIAAYYHDKAEVRVLDNLRSGYPRNLAGLNVEFIRGDVRDRVKVAAAMKNVEYVQPFGNVGGFETPVFSQQSQNLIFQIHAEFPSVNCGF